jgi:hypothetical protein
MGSVNPAQFLRSRGNVLTLDVGESGPLDPSNLAYRVTGDSGGHSLCSDVRCSHRMFSKNFLQEYRRQTGMSI